VRSKSKGKRSRRVQVSKDATVGLSVLSADTAGIDVGSREHWVAVPADRDPDPVRPFGTFTADLQELARWLKQCGIRAVAMESTGVYWIALFEVLEEAGFDVCVVNARDAKNVPGRKSDIQDCQWLQKLHSYGLLSKSFRPVSEVRVLRSYMRERENLASGSHQCVQHIQKALTEMNIRLVNVLSDIMGKSGRRILDAIMAGERDPAVLAKLVDQRVKTSQAAMRKSLEGDWRPEQLFIIEQQLNLHTYYHKLISGCDQRIEMHLKQMEGLGRGPAPTAAEDEPNKRDLHAALQRITGVDLTRIEGIELKTAQIIISEVGVDMSRWPTEKHFCSWLGLCPNHQITGGRILKRKTRRVVNRASTALRRAASTLLRNKSALGAKFRRLRARLGAPKAITAIAHHLARLVYRMIRYGLEYVAKSVEHYDRQYREQQIQWVYKRAAELNLQVTNAELLTMAAAD
jgi:transposase